MPELPEVQTTVTGLRKAAVGLTIKDAWTDYNSTFHKGKDSIKDPVYFKHFKKAVVGTRISRVERVAKNILIHIEKSDMRAVILVHMKMTGHIMVGKYVHKKGVGKSNLGSWKPAKNERTSLSDPYNRFIHFVISLSDGRQVVLCDSRKFAKVTLIHEHELKTTKHLEDIGPEPLEKSFTYSLFEERLGLRPTGRIKNILMDQNIIAGVGNIYSDEALWRAGIHPEERVSNIPAKKLEALYSSLITVLKKGIDFGGDSMSDYRNVDGERGKFQEHHQVYQKKGDKCSFPKCKGTIVRKVVGGRSAHYCDTHQALS